MSNCYKIQYEVMPLKVISMPCFLIR